MIRSAKMKARTPPKLMPPFQSTAASGTLPIEQTKLSIATGGPDQRPPELRERRMVLEEERPARSESGTQAASAPAISRPPNDVAPDGGPVHDEVVRGRGEARRASGAAARASPVPPTDMSISACPSIEPRRPLSASRACLVDEPLLQEDTEGERQQDDHQRPADELAEHELPAEQEPMMIPSSITRLVDANSKTIAAVKSAPLRNSERASATAA